MTGRRSSDWLRSPPQGRFQAEWKPGGRPESGLSQESGAFSDAKPVPTFAENAHEAEARDERSGYDRRKGDRRAPKRPLDPKFAATLLSQIMPAAEEAPTAYPRPASPRAGVVVNVKA